MSTHVVTSTHQKLGLQLSTNYTASVGGPVTVLDVSLATSGRTESHTWSFPVPNSAVSVGSSSKGTITVPAANLAPFGLAKLTIKPAGKPKTENCSQSAHVTVRKIKLSGILYFDTRSKGKHKWGHFGSKTKVTFTATGVIESAFGQPYTGCLSPTNGPCASSLGWGAGNHSDTMSLSGGPSGKSKGFIDGSRVVSLPKPKNASRFDSVNGSSPAPKLKSGASTATMSVTTSGGGASGSAKITNTMPSSSYPESCGNNKTETATSWVSALKNGKPGLALSEQVFGPIKLPNGSTASINVTTK